jgi:hypothetical protein
MNEFGPNPPSRRDEDFPKTTTIPEGWSAEHLSAAPAPTAGRENSAVENTRPAPIVEDESLFTRCLDPFPQPNTIPAGWDLSSL